MSFHLPWSKYSKFNAWWNGRRDGKIGIPSIDQEQHSSYEQELQKLAEENVRRIAQQWEDIDKKLKSDYCNLLYRLQIAEKGKEAITQEHNDSSEEVEEAQNMMKEIYGKEHLNPCIYIILISLLGISEFPLNSIVFDLFGEAKILTYIMSAGLALVIPLSAHFLGILLKREPVKKGILHTETILLFLSVLMPVFVLGLIASLREKFFEVSGVHKILGIEMDPLTIMVAFFGMNLLIFFGAAMLSYFHHDPDIRQRRRELKMAVDELDEDRKELGRFTALVETINRKKQEIQQLRQNEWDKKHHEANEIKNIVERLINHYRKVNQRARNDSKLPSSFLTYPKIEIPGALTTIDWNCAESIQEKYTSNSI